MTTTDKGASAVHRLMREELQNYIGSQYFGKTSLLFDAVKDELRNEGVLFREPYIESTPAYLRVANGFETLAAPVWLKRFFIELARRKAGVFESPFQHQLEALERFINGEDVFVATGTGSGKTECFIWPLLAKLATEARERPNSWRRRGVRTLIMYPMNALVVDQISRLRRLLGSDKFLTTFRQFAEGARTRRPQFGMYTGRTPYCGDEPNRREDSELAKTFRREFLSDDRENFLANLARSGKIPAKADMRRFVENLEKGRHDADPNDAEMITRFEMQRTCPDVFITNYSMLEYTLIRRVEEPIWETTRAWLNEDEANKLLFIIDEAHMYRGAAGAEVALLIRRLFDKVGVPRERVQFILTTASMPDKNDEDRAAVQAFAQDLTAGDGRTFAFLSGARETLNVAECVEFDAAKFDEFSPNDFEDGDETSRFDAFRKFWRGVPEFDAANVASLDDLRAWEYDNLSRFQPFAQLFEACRGAATSLSDLAKRVFGSEEKTEAASVLLAVATSAKKDDAVLFPARMHALFRGIKGVFACLNPECPGAVRVAENPNDDVGLGAIFVDGRYDFCPHCQSAVYELANDRRCGALFVKGWVFESAVEGKQTAFLWRYPAADSSRPMKEIRLFAAPRDFDPTALKETQTNADAAANKRKSGGSKYPLRRCYLDVKSGYVDFRDDSWADKPGVRTLYYSEYVQNERPDVYTFVSCPRCRSGFGRGDISTFSVRGDASFFNVISSQFQSQPSVLGKEHLPNEGRKVLLFSDSRQRAAKLARDMSTTADLSAARQLFALAVQMMERQAKVQPLQNLYGFVAYWAAKNKKIPFLHDAKSLELYDELLNAEKQQEQEAEENLERPTDWGDWGDWEKEDSEFIPDKKMDAAPYKMQEYMLRLFCGGHNSLYDTATLWLEPTREKGREALKELNRKGFAVGQQAFLDAFNAWFLTTIVDSAALGHTFADERRRVARPLYGSEGYGLKKDWTFSTTFQKIFGWDAASDKERVEREKNAWKQAFERFLDEREDTERDYVNLDYVRPRFDENRAWFRCGKCSRLTPFLLKERCPFCGSFETLSLSAQELDERLAFWRKPIADALAGTPIRLIDVEEHTAQLSHKDQRDELWSQTERYELRFQDVVEPDEYPVDILSSTTTMEVGVDIGSLVAVGLRNVPPTRENYQQRAGRAGRRGASLSTIVTFCEDGARDAVYFNEPEPMFRGDPRRPGVDVENEKLIRRHLALIAFRSFLETRGEYLDRFSALKFFGEHLSDFKSFVANDWRPDVSALTPYSFALSQETFQEELFAQLDAICDKSKLHPELFKTFDQFSQDKGNDKSLLDILYEEGVAPTYSFPKNVVSVYIRDRETGKIKYEVSRGVDVAIGEYAPGREIVVDKKSYKIGGFCYPTRYGSKSADKYLADGNYLKSVWKCDCGWFGFESDKRGDACPFCGACELTEDLPLLRPWGFAPIGGKETIGANEKDEYSGVEEPICSTVPNDDGMEPIDGCLHIRMATRYNQRVVLANRGPKKSGFVVCRECGAAAPAPRISPYASDAARAKALKEALKLHSRPDGTSLKCSHKNIIQTNLGCDFIADMLVLEIALPPGVSASSSWTKRAARTLAEALRKTFCKLLDLDFDELIAGFRVRERQDVVDVYLYDSLSSGAGYATGLAVSIGDALRETEKALDGCRCSSACFDCLKHYRNRFYHGSLDRFEALALLRWGRDASFPAPLSIEKQFAALLPLKRILKNNGIEISFDGEGVYATSERGVTRVVVHPEIAEMERRPGVFYATDSALKYDRPTVFDAMTKACAPPAKGRLF